METRYSVRQAVEMTGVKSYVLRYWEDELGLRIHRNEIGHRYYTGYDIQLFLNIKELKNRGLQLRAIRDLIPQIVKISPGENRSSVRLLNGETNEEAETACGDCEEVLSQEESCEKKESNEKILEFQMILERLIAQEIKSQNEEEERCRSLDLAIRRQQMARREAAAQIERKAGRKCFSKHKDI